MIYDRWGNKLYTQEGSSVCWDGTGYGKEMQPQVCTFILSLDMIDGFTEYKTGTIMVVK